MKVFEITHECYLARHGPSHSPEMTTRLFVGVKALKGSAFRGLWGFCDVGHFQRASGFEKHQQQRSVEVVVVAVRSLT